MNRDSGSPRSGSSAVGCARAVGGDSVALIPTMNSRNLICNPQVSKLARRKLNFCTPDWSLTEFTNRSLQKDIALGDAWEGELGSLIDRCYLKCLTLASPNRLAMLCGRAIQDGSWTAFVRLVTARGDGNYGTVSILTRD